MSALTEPDDEPACHAADPRLFDARTLKTAEPAFSYCLRCTVTDWCLDIVRPTSSWFDGVAAGRLYVNGKEIR